MHILAVLYCGVIFEHLPVVHSKFSCVLLTPELVNQCEHLEHVTRRTTLVLFNLRVVCSIPHVTTIAPNDLIMFGKEEIHGVKPDCFAFELHKANKLYLEQTEGMVQR